MALSVLDIHPEARTEAREARLWYLARSEHAATEFVRELDRAITFALEAPERWPPYLHGTRRVIFQRFPYSLVYTADQTTVYVWAVAHASRRPGYWKERKA